MAKFPVDGEEDGDVRVPSNSWLCKRRRLKRRLKRPEGEEDGVVRVPSSSWLGKRRRLKRRLKRSEGEEDGVVRVPNSPWLGKRRRLKRHFKRPHREEDGAVCVPSSSWLGKRRHLKRPEGEEDGAVRVPSSSWLGKRCRLKRRLKRPEGEEDGVELVPSSSWLGKRRRLKRRFISSGRSRSRPAEEEEGSKEGEEDQRSDGDRRDKLNPSEEELEEQDEGEHSKVGSLEFTLEDPDVLDCAICLEPLTSPVFQCENGHIACSSCCKMISNGCPSCSMPVGHRCCAVEKILESVRMACQNAKFGCNQKFGYHMKNDHEKTCPFAPCSCPFSSCSYVGLFGQLVKHLSSKHEASPTSFRFNSNASLSIKVETEVCLLKEEGEDVLFVFKNETIDLGSKIKISCIGPLAKADYAYDIEAIYRESSLKLHTCTKSVPDFEYDPNQEPCLLVPRRFFDDSLGLKLEVRIWRNEARD
ncbi:putative E3 ubiquitin-protein ligase SINA-like 9 [Syzygium oleosum]|uniref:putative E3 ubiquitin-protein ligase SINA-like 9 n=1 Tax=Syzygium oleosum TaxID=219896 RepID=UPI0011D1863B|nr:putative E3 ubiquitin-protein ligase SINA-like 9 [Syzygium oleosum]